eukprot:1677429-Rhodomonas_salina.1
MSSGLLQQAYNAAFTLWDYVRPTAAKRSKILDKVQTLVDKLEKHARLATDTMYEHEYALRLHTVLYICNHLFHLDPDANVRKELERNKMNEDMDLYLDDGNNMLLQEYIKNALLIDNRMLDDTVDVTLEIGH